MAVKVPEENIDRPNSIEKVAECTLSYLASQYENLKSNPLMIGCPYGFQATLA
jgi:hypothetical protein